MTTLVTTSTYFDSALCWKPNSAWEQLTEAFQKKINKNFRSTDGAAGACCGLLGVPSLSGSFYPSPSYMGTDGRPKAIVGSAALCCHTVFLCWLNKLQSLEFLNYGTFT